MHLFIRLNCIINDNLDNKNGARVVKDTLHHSSNRHNISKYEWLYQHSAV